MVTRSGSYCLTGEEQIEPTAEEWWMFESINVARAERGLKLLAMNRTLAAIARRKALDMVTNGYFSHTSPVLGSSIDQIRRAGVDRHSGSRYVSSLLPGCTWTTEGARMTRHDSWPHPAGVATWIEGRAMTL